jgi:hypothetical protein
VPKVTAAMIQTDPGGAELHAMVAHHRLAA